jgi:hypothetical protein
VNRFDGRRVDVHQHLWPAALIEQLRRRTRPPMLIDWTLHTAGEPPLHIDPAHHDAERRAALDPDTRILLSLSAPLGIEALPADEARPLLDAWHAGAAELAGPFGAWAAVSEAAPDLAGLTALFDAGFVGLQISATAVAHPAAFDAVAPVLQVCADAGRPVLVHPGPTRTPHGTPAWWPAVVAYPAQLQAAWWTWYAHGRSALPYLRIAFVAGAGLAPVQHERFNARSGQRWRADPDTYVDTSSFRRQGIDALTRALGVDVVVLGSDRPYAEPADDVLGDAERHAICVTNPNRLLEGGIA